MKIEQVTVTRADGKSGNVGHFSSAYTTYLQINAEVQTGQTYTIHGYVRSASASKISCFDASADTKSTWNEVSLQITPTTKTFSLVFAPGEFWFYNWKLEKGTVITQWTPSGEDLLSVKNTIITMGSSINQLKDSITSKVWMTEVNAAKGEVEAHVSTVEQRANKIDWLVKSGTDASNMVMTDQSIAWISKNINLTGNATFSSFLDSSKTYINGGKIATESITTTQISANAITSEKINVDKLSAISANLGIITAGNLSAININNGNGTFKVDSNGNLTASSANITGVINATSGSFKGNINIGNGIFTVDDTGKVSASNMNITGGEVSLKGNLSDSKISLQATDSEKNNYELWMNGAVFRISKNDENLITLYGVTGTVGAQSMYAQLISADKFRETDRGSAMCGDETGHTFHCSWTGSQLKFQVDVTWVWSSSDKRLKKNVNSINNDFIEAVGAVDLYQYNLNRQGYSDKPLYFGAMAQDVLSILKTKGHSDDELKMIFKEQATSTDSTLYYGMDYEQFLILRVAYDEKRISKLENQLDILNQQLSSLQNQVSSQGLTIQQQSLNSESVN